MPEVQMNDKAQRVNEFLDAMSNIVGHVMPYPLWFEEMAGRMTCYKGISEAEEIGLGNCDHCDLLVASKELTRLIGIAQEKVLCWREILDEEEHGRK
jgi:hypothetical protein